MIDLSKADLRFRSVLPIAWKIITELFRRHGVSHDLRILHSHPGSSFAGILILLVNPRPETLESCKRIRFHIGGPDPGTYEVFFDESYRSVSGAFLEPAFSRSLVTVIDSIETALGWRRPETLPSSTNSILTMRLISEVLSSLWLDKLVGGVETSWLDWSGGSRCESWVGACGIDTRTIDHELNAGKISDEAAYMKVSKLMRLTCIKNDSFLSQGWICDLDSGTISWHDGNQVSPPVSIQENYQKNNRRLEPLTAKVLSRLRKAGSKN